MFSCSHYHGVVPAESTIKLKVKNKAFFICVDWVKIGENSTWENNRHITMHTGFCPKMMSEEREQKITLYPELGSDTSSVWNFCTHSSDVIISRRSRGGILKCRCLILHLIDDFPNSSIYFLIFLISQVSFTPQNPRLQSVDYLDIMALGATNCSVIKCTGVGKGD